MKSEFCHNEKKRVYEFLKDNRYNVKSIKYHEKLRMI
jgi:hypothetical protein